MNEKTIEKSFDEYMKRIIQKIICLITKRSHRQPTLRFRKRRGILSEKHMAR